MNPDKQTEYSNLKADIAGLSSKLSDFGEKIGRLKTQLNEQTAQIQTIAATLENEDRLIAMKSRLKPPTLTIEQYKDQKSTMDELKAQLPALEEELESESRALSLLQAELSEKRRALSNVKDLLLVEVVDQSVAEFATTAGESFKKMVMAIVALEGKSKGFNFGQKEAFKVDVYNLICEQIVPAAFAEAKELPDLSECNQYVDHLLEAAA